MIFNTDYTDSSLMTSEEEKTERLLVCAECSNNQSNICIKSSYLIGMMVSYSFKSCPIGKW